MAHYDIFREQLAVKYPAYGHALWEPNPGHLYSPVEVGDVGYVREGKFHRLFNALLPADHASHRIFGVPEYHEPLTPPPEHIDIGILMPNHYSSHAINVGAAEPDLHALGPEDYPQVSYSCRRRQCGAVLFLPVQAQRQDTIARGIFGKWIIKHIDRWLVFAKRLGLGIEQMEDIILVTGCHRTRSWANTVFLESQEDEQISFGVQVADINGFDVGINWRFLPERIRGAIVHSRPSGMHLSEDQCVFIRGFRVTRTLKIFPKHLIAAAGPSSDPDEFDHGADTGLASFPTIHQYRDPLHILLEHIAERSPDSNMVLVHDDDLVHINGIFDSHESLQSDRVIHLLHKFQPKIQQITYDWPCEGEFISKPGSETTTIAMFSEEYQEWGVPSPRIAFNIVKSVADPGDAWTGQGGMVSLKGGHEVAELDSASLKKHITKSKVLSDADIREPPSSDTSIVCPIDNRIFLDAVEMPCCEMTYCEDCIQTHLLKSGFICPHCGSNVASLDKLAIDKPMRRKVADYIMKEIETSRSEEHRQIKNELTPSLTSSLLQAPSVKALQFGQYAQENLPLDVAMSQPTIDDGRLQEQIQDTPLALQNTGGLPKAVHEQVEVEHQQPQQRSHFRAPSMSSSSPIPSIPPSTSLQTPPTPYTPIPFIEYNGFLVRMFGQHDAAFFIESLLKTKAENVRFISNVPRWPNALMIQYPSTLDAIPAVVVEHPNMPRGHLWLLDFVPSGSESISPTYYVVPQKIWTPPNQSDWRRYVEQANLRMPVFFVQSDGSIGLPLTRATAGDTATLHRANSPAPLGGGHSTQIRIAWPGYESWERQIQIRDHTRYRNEITLERFAKLVAGIVDRFVTHAASLGVYPPHLWRIGEGGISRHHVFIVGAVQVSAGGWMPILQVLAQPAPVQVQHASHVHRFAVLR